MPGKAVSCGRWTSRIDVSLRANLPEGARLQGDGQCGRVEIRACRYGSLVWPRWAHWRPLKFVVGSLVHLVSLLDHDWYAAGGARLPDTPQGTADPLTTGCPHTCYILVIAAFFCRRPVAWTTHTSSKSSWKRSTSVTRTFTLRYLESCSSGVAILNPFEVEVSDWRTSGLHNLGRSGEERDVPWNGNTAQMCPRLSVRQGALRLNTPAWAGKASLDF